MPTNNSHVLPLTDVVTCFDTKLRRHSLISLNFLVNSFPLVKYKKNMKAVQFIACLAVGALAAPAIDSSVDRRQIDLDTVEYPPYTIP
jgi:hypothetical protein